MRKPQVGTRPRYTELYTLCHISDRFQGEFHSWVIYTVLQNPMKKTHEGVHM